MVVVVDFSSCYYSVPGDDGKVPEAGALFVKSHRGAILNSGRATTNSSCPDATDGYLMLHCRAPTLRSRRKQSTGYLLCCQEPGGTLSPLIR